MTHYLVVLRIVQYIKDTLLHGLHYLAQSFLILTGYSDVDWPDDPTNCRSTIGFYLFLGDSLVSWCNKKQTIVSRSSVEPEYKTLADTTTELFMVLLVAC